MAWPTFSRSMESIALNSSALYCSGKAIVHQYNGTHGMEFFLGLWAGLARTEVLVGPGTRPSTEREMFPPEPAKSARKHNTPATLAPRSTAPRPPGRGRDSRTRPQLARQSPC